MPHDDERDFAEEAANAAHMRDEHELDMDKSDTDKSDTDKSDTAERRAWQAAYATAWAGASNTAGLALGIHEIIVELRASGMTWYAVDSHPTVRAVVGHLAYLTGQGLGPTDENLRAVKNAGQV